MVRPDDFHRPKNGDPNNRNIQRSKRQVAKAELNGCERDIGDQIDRKWHGNWPRKLLSRNAVKDISKRDQNDRVEELPDQADRCRLGRPIRFVKGIVPVSPRHFAAFV